MITDDVRRETAKRLREKKKEFFGGRSWFPQDLILYQMGARRGSDRSRAHGVRVRLED